MHVGEIDLLNRYDQVTKNTETLVHTLSGETEIKHVMGKQSNDFEYVGFTSNQEPMPSRNISPSVLSSVLHLD